MIHHRTLPVEAPAELVVGDGRTVTVRVVSWDTPYRVTDDGSVYYREQFAPGGLRMADGATVYVRAEHDPAQMGARQMAGFTDRPGEVVGRVIATRNERDGLYADLRIAATAAGDDQLALIADGIVGAVSSEFDDDPITPGADQLITRTTAELVGVAFTLHPQHTDARVVGVRSTPAPEATTMPDTTTHDDTPGTDTPDGTSDDTSGAPAPNPPVAAVTATRSAPVPVSNGAPRSQFRSFGAFASAAARGELNPEQRDRYFRALAAADTDDATGLVTAQWLREVIDIYRTMTPTVQAFDQRTLPPSGLTVSQPIVTTRPAVGLQATQNTEVSSTAAVIGSTSWTVVTFAGGQNTSIQTILRSEPAYLDELMRLYLRELALDVNTKVAAALLAAADDVNTTAAEYTTAAAFDELIVDASAVFMDTLHRPAEVVGLSVDLWKALAKAKDTAGDYPIYPSLNPMNRQGTFNAVSTSGQIVSVDWYVDPAIGGVGDGIKGVIGVRDAFRTLLGPIGTLTADTPATLGRDTAVYQFGAYGKVDAAGLYLIANAV